MADTFAKTPTDAQLVLLTAAAGRPDRSLLPPPSNSKAKRAALQRVLASLLNSGLAQEQATTDEKATWRVDDTAGRLTLVISRAGFQALGIAADEPETAAIARAGTKTATVLALLRGRGGATLADLMQATGWQAHSVRGFLSATVRKKLGLPLVVEAGESGRHYRIAA
jgi:hypothetical protein